MWKKDFCKLFCSSNLSSVNIEKAIELKFNNIPTLYKYTPFNEHSLDILTNDQLWMSSPLSFNDPFDCEYTFNYGKPTNIFNFLSKSRKEDFPDLDHEKIDKVMEEIFNNAHEDMVKHFTNISKHHLFIVCLSEIKDSVLMWSHYANNHEGICIEFDFKQLGVTDPRTRILFPVFYNEDVFDTTKYLKAFSDNEKTFNNLMDICSAINKSDHWSYEKEWRIVSNIDKEPGPLPYCPKPNAIYLGTSIEEKNKEIVMKIAENRKIDVYKMKKMSGYCLESKKIYDSSY